jgi:hypothetical protein
MNKIKLNTLNPGNHGPEEILGVMPCWPSNYIEWSQEPSDTCVWVDYWEGVVESSHKYKIAVLLEPKSLCPHNYSIVENLIDHFDLVFIHYKEDINKNPKYRYYEGGCRCFISPNDRMLYPKSKNISSVVSPKRFMEGHHLRHLIKHKITNNIDSAYYNTVDYLNPPMDRKVDGIKDYRFELVIENEDADFFSEKILDSMVCGCIPIYWNVKTKEHLKMFDMDGIIFFDTPDKLLEMISNGYFTQELYESKLKAIKYNFEKAKEFISFGDALWNAGLKDFLTINNQI